MIHETWKTVAALCVAVAATASAQTTPGATSPPPNTLTAAERAAGWRLLFDGRTLEGWRGLGRDTVPTAHWVVENGAIKKVKVGAIAERGGGLPPVSGGDLMTEATFGDFELSWE